VIVLKCPNASKTGRQAYSPCTILKNWHNSKLLRPQLKPLCFAVAGGSLNNNCVPNISIGVDVNEAPKRSEALVLSG